MTLKAIVVNDIYNDLGMIIKDKIIFLLESQSTWSVNILVHSFLYLANTYKNYLTKNKVNLYGSKKVKLPTPELYVICVGKDEIKNKTISLNKEYFNNKSPIDLKIKVITESEKNNIVGEYIEFSIKVECDDTVKQLYMMWESVTSGAYLGLSELSDFTVTIKGE